MSKSLQLLLRLRFTRVMWIALLVVLVLFVASVEGDSQSKEGVCHSQQDENDATTAGTCDNDNGSEDHKKDTLSEGNSNSNPNLCHSQFSQTSLAIAMSQQTSPPGSPSYKKLQRILSHHKRFHVDLGGSHQGMFDAVVDNMAVALEGYGLTRASSMYNTDMTIDTGVLLVEGLFSSHRSEAPGRPFYVQQTGIIILQTEQICCTEYGKRSLPYMQLCHASPHCMIWEYSSRNWEWLVEQGLGDSVMLLPILHQHRLNPYYYGGQEQPPQSAIVDPNTPLSQRPIDVVFFGVMTPRRQQLKAALTQTAQQQQWNVQLEEVENSGSRLDYMAKSYGQAKICLIWHSFHTVDGRNPGAYHRLSELAPSGCIPVVETFGDVLLDNKNEKDVLQDYYGRCGGVLFVPLNQLGASLQSVLYSVYNSHYNVRLQDVLGDTMPELAAQVDGLPSLEERLAWWNNSIQWDRLLHMILGDNDNGGDNQDVPDSNWQDEVVRNMYN